MKKQKVTRKKLENNSQLVHIFVPNAPSGAIATFVKAGNRFDPQNHSGLAHFVDHMTLSGTKKYPSAAHLHTALEQYGAWYEAFTYPDYVYLPLSLQETVWKKWPKI